MTDIPEELVERVRGALKRTEMPDGDWFIDMLATWGDEEDTAARLARSAIRAVLDWQANPPSAKP